MLKTELTPRLSAVCEMVPVCDTCADVGCDHAHAAIHLVQTGKVQRMTASDVNPGPLSRAQRAVRDAGLSDKISCVLSDGLEKLAPQDCVIIAGMGGDLISDILARAEWTRYGNRRLILQPMTAAKRLREFLCRSGYSIVRETYASERDKLYAIICAEPGEYTPQDASEYYISRAGESDPLAAEYAARVIGKLEKEISGLRAAAQPDLREIRLREEAAELITSRFSGGRK